MTTAMIRIHYADGRIEDRAFPLGNYRVGREAGEVVLGDPNTSSRHAELYVEPGRVGIADVGSTNGTYDMNGQRVAGFHVLQPGHWVRMGNSGLTLLSAPPVQAAPPPFTPAPGPAMPAAHLAAPPQMAAAAGFAPPQMPAAAGFAPSPIAASAGTWGSIAASPAAATGDSPYSHPDQPVRHSYPVTQTAFGIGGAMQLLMKTFPYLIVRLGTLLAMSTVGLVYWVVVVAGFLYLQHHAMAIIGWAWFVTACVVAGWFWRVILRSFLFLLKMGHIAVLTELVTHGQIGNGEEGMFSYGKRMVVERFGEVAALFAVDALIAGVVGAFNRTLDWVSGLIPIPGLQSIVHFVQALVRACTRYIAETIFSYNLARGDSNVFRSSRDGLVYYAQNAKAILKTGLWVVVLERVLSGIIFFVVFVPFLVVAIALVHALPNWAGWLPVTAIIAGILYAGNVREAFLKPLFLTMIMLRFHSCVRGQAINPEWDQRLQGASNKFRELASKAAAWISTPKVPAGAPQPAMSR